MSPQGARDKAELLAWAAERLLTDGVAPTSATVGCFCPGRLEVLGKHTDYAGGRSLIAAPELGVAMILCAGTAGRVRAHSQQDPDTCDFGFEATGAHIPTGWALYPATVLHRLAHNFPGQELGCHLACASDLPLAAGMSSSSALMTATFLCLTRLFSLDQCAEFLEQIREPKDLAMLVSCVENGQSFGTFEGDEGVGTFGGSEDHTAMLCSRQGHLSQYSFCPIELERRVRIPSDMVFVTVQSGVIAEKASGALESYNRLALLAQELTRLAAAQLDTSSEGSPNLAAYLRSDPENGQRLEQLIRKPGQLLEQTPEDLLKRLQHFHLESEELIPAWPDPWTGASVPTIASLAERSTVAARDLLGNQVPETLWLTEALGEAGALAASPFGAGFGGSVWALIQRSSREEVLERLRCMRAPTRELQIAMAQAQTSAMGPGAITL